MALYSWVFSSYLLASTVTVPVYGKLADVYGRKPIFTFGTLVFPYLLDDPVDAGAHRGGRLAPRDAVEPQRPSGSCLANVNCRAALVEAVVPLEQVVAGFDRIAETGQPARFKRPDERAGDDPGELLVGEVRAELAGLLPAVVGERDVRPAGVATAEGPLGLAVADEKHLAGHPRAVNGHQDGINRAPAGWRR
jgi:hypothetical protein